LIITRVCETCGTIHQVKDTDSFVCCKNIFFPIVKSDIKMQEQKANFNVINEIKFVKRTTWI